MGKSDVLKAVRVGCRGRMQAIVGEGAATVARARAGARHELRPYAWASLVHREIRPNGSGAPAGPARITIDDGNDPLFTKIVLGREELRKRMLTVRASRGTAKTHQTLFWRPDTGTGGNVEGVVPPIGYAVADVRMRGMKLREHVSRANRNTREWLCHTRGEIGIRADSIAALYNRQPIDASVRMREAELPFDTLGSTAEAPTAIHSVVADNGGGNVLIERPRGGQPRGGQRVVERHREHGPAVRGADHRGDEQPAHPARGCGLGQRRGRL